ncbi:hypothetical protein PVLB_07600 [Pseudomonas sp. VLB120]|nr:hypothetical protein PVLB_07600 [Pseudomonas sp. VLB120]
MELRGQQGSAGLEGLLGNRLAWGWPRSQPAKGRCRTGQQVLGFQGRAVRAALFQVTAFEQRVLQFGGT